MNPGTSLDGKSVLWSNRAQKPERYANDATAIALSYYCQSDVMLAFRTASGHQALQSMDRATATHCRLGRARDALA